jgi:uncharacterized SAM-binding protein YcdF (DUF218 family)
LPCRRGSGKIPAVSVDRWARVVWDYHRLGHELRPADAIVALGSHDTRVAERAAEVYLEGWAPLVVMSGRTGALTGGWERSEAEVFADVAEARGVPRERMLLEARSTNTGENVAYTRALLAERGTLPSRVIAVQKPYMERRTFATFEAGWPGLDVVVTSPRLGFEEYVAGSISRDDVLHIMVGDLQRLWLYAERGWSSPQPVPPEVREAYDGLVAAGYTRRLVGGAP